LIVRIRARFISKSAGTTQPAAAGEAPRPSKGTILFAIAAALQKGHLTRVALNLKKRGFTVICDRWPQNQVLGMNDGPLLTRLRDDPNSFLRSLARWEEKQFEKVCSSLKPDLVVRLLPSPETAMMRKEENRGAEALVRRKIDFVRNLPFPGVKDVAVNADLRLETVLEKVRAAIWNHIQELPAQRPGFYECAGLSGAGKTAVCKALYASDLNLKPVSSAFGSADAVTKALMMVASFIADPLIYFYAARAALELELWREPKALECLLRLPVQKRRLAAAANSERFLLEELLLQNLWSTLVLADVRSARPECLAPLIARLYRGIDPVIFHFKITPETAAHRVSSRTDGKSPYFDNLPERETAGRLRRFAGVMEDVMKAASHAGLRIVPVDASQPIETIVGKIILPIIEAGESARP
jgi:thymidylate kinase